MRADPYDVSTGPPRDQNVPRAASPSEILSSPRKLPSYGPERKILAMTAEMISFVQNSWVRRVPSPWSSNVACSTPRRSQLPKRVLTKTRRVDLEDRLGLRIWPNQAV